MLTIFMTLGIVLVVGLLVVPAIDEAQARSAIASVRNKGQQVLYKVVAMVAAIAVLANRTGAVR